LALKGLKLDILDIFGNPRHRRSFRIIVSCKFDSVSSHISLMEMKFIKNNNVLIIYKKLTSVPI